MRYQVKYILLWGNRFYCLCYCSAIKKILQYYINIPMIFCWSQEIFGYHINVIHIPDCMMSCDDACTCRFWITASLTFINHQYDQIERTITTPKGIFFRSFSNLQYFNNPIYTRHQTSYSVHKLFYYDGSSDIKQ